LSKKHTHTKRWHERIKAELAWVPQAQETGFAGQPVRVRTRHKDVVVPIWATNNVALQHILLKIYPKMWTCTRQKFHAGRLAGIVERYYREGWTEGQIAEELGMTIYNVRYKLRAIRNAAQGMWTNGKGRTGTRPRGRPRKPNNCTVESSVI